MKVSVRSAFLLAIMLVLGCAGFAKGQQVPPEPFTLWKFLGIPEGFRKVRGNLVNRRGNFPNLEQRLPMRALADPRNLYSENPAIKAAAEIKSAELLAPQKIKSIKYLATIGCGCYDKDGKITNALLAAMADDCTERVRLEAVLAISSAAYCQVCDECNQRCCCNEAILQQLAAMAYERDEFGCWLEPSARVRQAAEQALRACCTGGPPELLPPPEGIEGNERRGTGEGVERLPSADSYGAQYAPAPVVDPIGTSGLRFQAEPISHPGYEQQAAPIASPPATPIASPPAAPFASFPATPMVSPQAIVKPVSTDFGSYIAVKPSPSSTGSYEGAIVGIDTRQSRASVRFTTDDVVPVGTYLYVYQSGPEGVVPAGSLLVSSSRPGEATVIARPGTSLASLAMGDVVIGTSGTARR
jgi:hypothetical protein